MEERCQSIQKRYQQLEEHLCDQEVLKDPNRLKMYAKERAELEPICTAYAEYCDLQKQRTEMQGWLAEVPDEATQEWLQEELKTLAERLEKKKLQLQGLILPKDPDASKNVIVEIRGAAGGAEAALFAMDLYRMYIRYAEKKAWKVELLEKQLSDLGGFKEVIFSVKGKGIHQHLKHENGIHRVQRVPATESGGRIHTSTAAVAILPEAEEVEIEIHDKDLRIDTFCSSGPGGQSVNTTKSAVRVTHLPTGLVVSCQDEKSQISNKAKAIRVLRARLYDRKQQEEAAKRSDERLSAMGTGDRSERIRTYNFPQSRVTEHRIGLTLHRLESILDGDLDELVQALLANEQEQQLRASIDT